MPNCHLVFVYDAGHAISTDRPEAFTEVVADFLERHEAFVISRTETSPPLAALFVISERAASMSGVLRDTPSGVPQREVSR